MGQGKFGIRPFRVRIRTCGCVLFRLSLVLTHGRIIMHSVRMRVSVRLGLWLGLGLILHKTSTLNINRNPQNVLFQVALGDIFGPEKKHASSSSAVIGHIQQV